MKRRKERRDRERTKRDGKERVHKVTYIHKYVGRKV